MPKGADKPLVPLSGGDAAQGLRPELFFGHSSHYALAQVGMLLAIGYSRRESILKRIFARCEVQGECFIWKGPHSGEGRGGGYGRFSFEGSTAAVHRTVYSCVHGPIPPKKQIDHTCNNRSCCNPLHLKAETHKKNQKLRDDRRKSCGDNL